MNDHDRIVRVEERLAAGFRARDLQASEYERRLSDLNHEAARIAANNAVYLPREVYETSQREVVRRAELLAIELTTARAESASVELVDAMSARVKLVEDWKNKATGAAVILTLISGAIGAAIARALG